MEDYSSQGAWDQVSRNELSPLCALKPSWRRSLCVIRPGMTSHSRTRCKRSPDEFTNKMLKSRGHMSPAGRSSVAGDEFPAPSAADGGEHCWQGRQCSLRPVLTWRTPPFILRPRRVLRWAKWDLLPLNKASVYS